ncbi:uncharacterized protein PV06_11929, partial [Exophiala oligosperma]
MVFYTTLFEKAIANAPDFRFGLYELIDPIHVSIVEHLIWGKISMTERQWHRYLHPRRLVPGCEDWIAEKIASGHTVMLVGKDTDLLMKGIKDPVWYYKIRDFNVPLSVWLAPVNKDAQDSRTPRLPRRIVPPLRYNSMYIHMQDSWLLFAPMFQSRLMLCEIRLK